MRDSSTEQQKMLKSHVTYVFQNAEDNETYTNFLVYEKSFRIHRAMYVQHLLHYYTCMQEIDIVMRMLPQHCLYYSGQLVKKWKIRTWVGWCTVMFVWAGPFSSFLLFSVQFAFTLRLKSFLSSTLYSCDILALNGGGTPWPPFGLCSE